MSKPIKIAAIVIAVVLAVLILAVGIIAATFNPNDYKAQVIRLVHDKTQRTLTIPGDIRLRFFPRLGADLGRLTLSQRNSHAPFLSVEHARISLAVLPLLQKNVVVDHVAIDGLAAHLVRFKDGTTDIDDFFSGEKSGNSQVRFDIDSVDLSHASISFDDRQEQRTIVVDRLDLETGKIAAGAPSKFDLKAHVKASKPAVDADVSVKSGFTIAPEQQHYVLKDLEAGMTGKLPGLNNADIRLSGSADLKLADKRFALDDLALAVTDKTADAASEIRVNVPKLVATDTRVAGDKLEADAKLVRGARTIGAHVGATAFDGTRQAFRLPSVVLEVTAKDKGLDAHASITGAFQGDLDKLQLSSPQIKLTLSGKAGGSALDGHLTTPVSADLTAHTLKLPNIDAAFTLPNPNGGAMRLAAAGSAAAALDKKTVNVQLKGKLDESSFDAKLGMNSFSPPAYRIDIGIDRLNADRYLAAASGKAADGKTTNETASAEKAGKPLDLSALQGMQAGGAVKIGALTVKHLQLAAVRADVHLADGKLALDPLAATLYGGSATGAVSAWGGKAPRFAVRESLSGIHVGPLLKDALGKEPINGRGNVVLDVTTAGGTFAQMMQRLDGTARLELRDGAVYGINIAQTVRNAKAKLGALGGNAPAQTGTSTTAEKTDFSEMSGSFRIANGVARNDDLAIKSPLIRAGGSGNIDLGHETLDYLVRATIVSTLQGQGGPELQALKGLTIPVRLTGPFAAINWHVDFAGLARDVAKEKLGEKKEELKGKARERLQQELKGLFGK